MIGEEVEGLDGIFRMTSRPKLRTTLVDYGKNLENVERVMQVYLKETTGLIEMSWALN